MARRVQGLAAGGEFGSAAAFLAEFSPVKHRGFGVSWLEVGSLLGFLLASLTVLVLNSSMGVEAVHSWGWRIPFLLTAPLGIIGFYIRSRVEGTPEFQSLQELETVAQSPVKEVFTRNWKQLLQTSGIEIMMNVCFYIVLVYLLTYQEEVIGLDASHAALLSTAASVTALILVPLCGALSDRVGRKPLLTGAAVLMIVVSYPLFLLMHSDAVWAPAMSTVGLGVVLAVVLGVHAVAVAELFPTRTLQTGLSIAYSVTAAVFVGTVPYLLTWIISTTGNVMAPAFYLIAVGLLGLGTLATMRETRGIDLLATDVAKASGQATSAADVTPSGPTKTAAYSAATSAPKTTDATGNRPPHDPPGLAGLERDLLNRHSRYASQPGQQTGTADHHAQHRRPWSTHMARWSPESAS